MSDSRNAVPHCVPPPVPPRFRRAAHVLFTARFFAAPCVLAGAVLLAGCASTSTPSDSSDYPGSNVTTRVLPLRTGGTVAVESRGLLDGGRPGAADRLLAWDKLVETLSGTTHTRRLPARDGTVLEELLGEPARAAGADPAAAAEALRTWRAGSAERFSEVRRMLAELAAEGGPGASLCGEDRHGELTATTFSTSRGAIFVLGEMRHEQTERGALLVEIHFYVSNSYLAGLNAYHLDTDESGAARLTVRLESWVTQVDGFLGAISRPLAEAEMLRQVEKTWHEVAAYLREAPPPAGQATAGP